VEFLERRAHEWCGSSSDLLTQSYFFCLVYGRTPALLWACDTREKWLEQLAAWRRDCGLSAAEISRSLTEFLDQERIAADESKKQEREHGPADLGWLIEMLLREYGHTVEYWVWQCDLVTIQLLKSEHDRREWARIRAESGKTDPNDPQLLAIRAFRDAEADFIARKKAA
jgi:hypothetical protein